MNTAKLRAANAKVRAKIDALPFVRPGGRKAATCYWSVTPSDDNSADYWKGRDWACLFLPLLDHPTTGASVLSCIVADMIAAGEKNGLVLGFIGELGDRLHQARLLALTIQAIATRQAKEDGKTKKAGAADTAAPQTPTRTAFSGKVRKSKDHSGTTRKRRPDHVVTVRRGARFGRSAPKRSRP
jgi:hypothetical protein